MYDEVCTKSQAKGLPEGWTWRDWNDGSGGLHSPDGKEYAEYDAQTREYRFTGERWTFFEGYPYKPESLVNVKEYIERHVRDMLTRENALPEKKAVRNQEAR
ncbi:hypothetical protein LJB90_00480 [Eubacteriales bacterium OttesenSCG-928-G02]|nr:hypothetical protein [Eubacteriales bacterium OttesenSCG-928-G02]